MTSEFSEVSMAWACKNIIESSCQQVVSRCLRQSCRDHLSDGVVVSAGGLTDVRVDLSHFEPEFQVLHEGLLRELVQQNKVRLPILGRAEGGHASLLHLAAKMRELRTGKGSLADSTSGFFGRTSEARSDCFPLLHRETLPSSDPRPVPGHALTQGIYIAHAQ